MQLAQRRQEQPKEQPGPLQDGVEPGGFGWQIWRKDLGSPWPY